MKLRFVAIAGFLASFSGTATAGIFADDLTRCTVNSTTLGDRTALMRWMFVVASANPAFVELTAITEEERQQGFRDVALVFNRLILHDCRREAIAALRNEGQSALEGAFRTLGEVAGREMMNSPASAASAGELDHFLDRPGLEALAREAGMNPSGHPAPTP